MVLDDSKFVKNDLLAFMQLNHTLSITFFVGLLQAHHLIFKDVRNEIC